jgi:hypothetical protein
VVRFIRLSGNRTNRTAISGAWAEYGIDDVNRIANQTNHFANGVQMQGWNDALGQWETIVQTYDGLNRVVTRNVNGALTQNVWDGWNLIAEHRGDWSLQRCYLYGANQNELVGAFDGGEYTTTTYWQDGRGNTSQVNSYADNTFHKLCHRRCDWLPVPPVLGRSVRAALRR